MINFLHLITSLNIGGTENFLLTLLTHLKHKYNFYVGYINKGKENSWEKAQIAERIAASGIPVIHLPSITSIIKFIKEKEIQILHTHLYRANIYGRIAGKISKVKYIISSQRSIDSWKEKKPYYIWLDRFTAKFCNKIIVNSYAAKNILIKREKIPAEKIVVVYNGINVSKLQVSTPKEIIKAQLNIPYNLSVVICITRLHLEKGVDLIPKIAKEVLLRNKKILFLIVGDGPERKNLQSAIYKLQLQNNIILTGWRDDIPEILNITDVFLLCSREESFPQSVLEAMAVGIPVVAADVGGVKELVIDGECGFLVKNPDEYSQKIIELLKNEQLRNSFSIKAKQIAKQFTIENMVNQIDTLYSQLAHQMY